MPDYRGRKGSSEDLLPKNRRAWALDIWADREEVAKLPLGAWLLREAAKELGFMRRWFTNFLEVKITETVRCLL